MRFTLVSSLIVCSLPIAICIEPVTLSYEHDGRAQVIVGKNKFGGDGKIKGLAGFGHSNVAKAIGANALRTWDYSQWHWAFKNANEHGLKVSAGIGITRDKKYYTTDAYCSIADTDPYWSHTLKKVLGQVSEYKANPALLWWTVGNELEEQVSFANGNDCLWKRVEWLASKVKEADPHHPVGTVLANVAPGKVGKIANMCPSLDFIGINVYGNDARNLGGKLRSMHWKKPYAIMEYGVPGWWSVPKTSWGARLETMTSTLKSPFFTETCNECNADKLCLGSYAFLWGWKWEKTGTWFGLFNQWKEAGGSGNAMDTLFALEKVWKPHSGIKPPVGIKAVNILEKSGLSQPFIGFSTDPGTLVQIDVVAVGAVTDVTWLVTPESDSTASGNAHENSLSSIGGAVRPCGKPALRALLDTSRLDVKRGRSYRIYVFVRAAGPVGTAEASASIPFLLGKQDCHTAKEGEECYREIKRAKESCERKGLCSWPADSLLPSSSLLEFQAAFHKNRRNNCPAPCSLVVDAGLKATCNGAPHATLPVVADGNKVTASCAHYGCGGDYVPKNKCQCNSECEEHDSCCSDYVTHCVDKSDAIEPSEANETSATPQTTTEPLVCGEPEPHSKCEKAAHWAMTQGIHRHPDWYPGLSESSSADQFQFQLYNEGKNGCPLPCSFTTTVTTATTATSTSTTTTATTATSTTTTSAPLCEDVPHGSACSKAVDWARKTGIRQHPQWYPGLRPSSSFSDFQALLHSQGQGECPQPCDVDGQPLAQAHDLPEEDLPSASGEAAADLSVLHVPATATSGGGVVRALSLASIAVGSVLTLVGSAFLCLRGGRGARSPNFLAEEESDDALE